MSLRKSSQAAPEYLLSAVDRAARARESRNRFVTRVLRAAVRARRDATITQRLNELFADPQLAAQHRREAVDLDAIWRRRDNGGEQSGPDLSLWASTPVPGRQTGHSSQPMEGSRQ